MLLVLCPLSILCCCTKLRNFFKKQLGAIIFGRIIVFMDASMLVITTCSWINLYQVHSGTMEISLSYYVSIGSLVLIAISSAGIFTYLFCNISKLDSKSDSVKARVGLTYEGYDVKNSAKSTLTLIICHIVRRTTIGSIITFSKDNPLI